MHIVLVILVFFVAALVYDYGCYYQSSIFISVQNKGPWSEKIMERVKWGDSITWVNVMILFSALAMVIVGEVVQADPDFVAIPLGIAAFAYLIARYWGILQKLRGSNP
jgi:hypothetical protein